MGIRLAIASMPNDEDVLKAPTIHKMAFLRSFSSIFKGYDRGALLA